jgi:hypothetical protein
MPGVMPGVVPGFEGGVIPGFDGVVEPAAPDDVGDVTELPPAAPEFVVGMLFVFTVLVLSALSPGSESLPHAIRSDAARALVRNLRAVVSVEVPRRTVRPIASQPF